MNIYLLVPVIYFYPLKCYSCFISAGCSRDDGVGSYSTSHVVDGGILCSLFSSFLIFSIIMKDVDV